MSVRPLVTGLLVPAVVLLAAGCNDQGPLSPKLGAHAFPGLWLNVDPDTRENPRAEIARMGAVLTVHMWGSCFPEDCDWGESSAPVSEALDGQFEVVFDSPVARRVLTLSVDDDRQLRIHSAVSYHDGRPGRENAERFRRVRFD